MAPTQSSELAGMDRHISLLNLFLFIWSILLPVMLKDVFGVVSELQQNPPPVVQTQQFVTTALPARMDVNHARLLAPVSFLSCSSQE